MLSRLLLLAQSAVFLLFSAHAIAADQRTISIQVIGESKFDMVYHRAAANATGAALGGLIGAGIQAGVEAEKDSTKRQALLPHVPSNLWQDTFVKTLNEAFVAKDYQVVWVEGTKPSKDSKADIYLTIYPQLYGVRMVDTSTRLVSGFIEFQATYSPEPAAKGKKAVKENFTLTGKHQGSYEALLAAPSSLGEELTALHAQAAQRLANKVIYNVKP